MTTHLLPVTLENWQKVGCYIFNFWIWWLIYNLVFIRCFPVELYLAMECVFFYFQMVNLWSLEWIFSFFLTIYFFQSLFGLFYTFSAYLFGLFYPSSGPLLDTGWLRMPITRNFSQILLSFLKILTWALFSYVFWLPLIFELLFSSAKLARTSSCDQFCMHSSLSKKCTSNFTNRDTNLFGTSLECTPYQKRCTSKFQKHRQRFILDQFCMHPYQIFLRQHSLWTTPYSIGFYSFLFFCWILSFSLFLFSYIGFYILLLNFGILPNFYGCNSKVAV